MPNTLILNHIACTLRYISILCLSPNTHINNHSHLPNLISLLSKYPPHFQPYAFIIAISPHPSTNGQQLARQLDPRCLTVLRQQEAYPHTCPFQHKGLLHPLQVITTSNSPASSTTTAYEYINQQITRGRDNTTQQLQQNLPFIPNQLTQGLIQCNHPITGFKLNPNIALPTHAPPRTQPMQTHIITWNTCYINSNLPYIVEIIETYKTNQQLFYYKKPNS